MKLLTKVIPVLGAALFLAVGSAWAGQGSKSSAPKATKTSAAQPAAKTKTMTANGTVTSMDQGWIAVNSGKKGAKDMRFRIDPTTQQEGTTETGSKVAVQYRVENGENVATSVKVHPMHAQAHKK